MASFSERFFNAYVRFLIRHNAKILVAFAVLFLLALIPASRIKFKTSFQDLLPPDAESVRNIDELVRLYGGEGFMVVILKGLPLAKMGEFAETIVPQLEKLDTIEHVSYKIDPTFFRKNAFLFMDLKDLQEIERRIQNKIRFEERRNNPLLIRLEETIDNFTLADIIAKYPTNQLRTTLSTADGKKLILLVKPGKPATDIDFTLRLVTGVEKIIRSNANDPLWKGLEYSKNGRYQMAYEDNILLNRDLDRLGLLSIVLILGVLWLFYRSVKAIMVIFIPLMTGVMFNFGVTGATVGSLNMLSGFLTGILAGLGLEVGIYILSRYFEERARHPWPRAMMNCLRQTGTAALFAAATVAVSFYALLFSGFRGFTEFGFIAGNGMVITSFVSLTLFPTLIIFFEKNRKRKIFRLPAPKSQHRDSSNTSFYWAIFENRGFIRLASLLVVLGSLALLTRTTMDFNFANLRGIKSTSDADLVEVEKDLGLTLNPTVLITKDPAVTRSIVSEIRERVASNEFKAIRSAASVMDFVPADQEEKAAIVGRLRAIYEQYAYAIEAIPEAKQIRDIKQSLYPEVYDVNKVPLELKREFTSKDGSNYFVSITPGVSMDDGSQLVHLLKEINSLREPKSNYMAAGSGFVFSDIFTIIYGRGYRILLITFAMVIGLVILLFRNVKDVLVITVSIILSLVIGGALVAVLGLSFTYLNVIVIPILFGMGIDNSIHIIYRLRRTHDSLPKMMHHISQAVIASSVTNILGFSALILAEFRGLQGIGLMATLGMVAVILFSLIILPVFLPWLYKQAVVPARP